MTSIPDWLAPHKHEWRSISTLGHLMQLENGKPLTSWFVPIRHRCQSKRVPCATTRTKTATLFLVKHVWAMACAHQVTLAPSLGSKVDLRGQIRELTRKVGVLQNNIWKREHHDRVRPASVLGTQLLMAKDPEPAPGVYFLIDAGQVVYVGQSQNVTERVRAHTDKTFSSVKMIETTPGQLLLLERRMIDVFRPVYNIYRPGSRGADPFALTCP